jgi:hypothetical protein
MLGLAFGAIGVPVQALAGWVAGSLSQALRRNQRAVCSMFRFSGKGPITAAAGEAKEAQGAA